MADPDYQTTDREKGEPRLDIKALVESLAEIRALRQEKTSQKEVYESQMQALKDEHGREEDALRFRIAGLELRIKELETENSDRMVEISQLREEYAGLRTVSEGLDGEVDCQDIGEALAWNQYDFMMRDCKVPEKLIKTACRFIDFKKYLGIAAEKGAVEALSQSMEILRSVVRG